MKIEEVLKAKLTKEQLDAATDKAKEILCLACAGSGKSRTLAYRIARLIAEGESPKSIVAFTFTNKAAESIKIRVASALTACGMDPKILGAMYIGTIDSYCSYILGEIDADYRQFEVLDENKLVLFLMSRSWDIDLRAIIKEKGNDRYFNTIGELAKAWKDTNNEMLDFAKITKEDELLGQTLKSIRDVMIRDKFMDFSYTIRLTVEQLKKSNERAKIALHEVKHIMVDEYQDVNPAQEELIENLYKNASTLFVVGDDDQSIYSWRGADVNNILEFEERYTKCKKHELLINFRSTPAIIDCATVFAEKQLGASRHPKKPVPDKENINKPNQIGKYWFNTRDEEAEWIAGRIKYLLEKGYFENESKSSRGLSPGDFAILMRATHGSGETPRHTPFTLALDKLGIEYYIETEGSIFQRLPARVMKDTFGILRDGNPDRTIVKEHWDNIVKPVFPKGDFRKFTKIMSEWGRLIHEPRTGARRRVYPQELVHRLLDCFAYNEADFNFTDNQSLGIFSRIMLDVESVYMSIDSDFRFKEVLNFLGNIAESGYQTSQDIVLQRPDMVLISTVHKAKGLEFPAVFVADLEQNRFPGSVDKFYKGWLPQKLMNPAFELGRYANNNENDARLFYTAITRAERYLYLSGCENLPGGKKKWKPSVYSAEFKHNELATETTQLPTGLTKLKSQPRVDDSIKPTSFTEVQYYLNCPKDYQFRKQYGFNPSVPALFGFGQTTHTAVGKLHEQFEKKPPTAKQVEQVVDKSFHLKHVPPSKDPDNKPGPYERAKEKTKQVAKQYVKDYDGDFTRERRIEARFEIPAKNTVISGSIDLMLKEDKKGNILDATVVDFKSIRLGDDETNPSIKANVDWISLSLQVQLYALAAKQVLGENAKTGKVHFLFDSKRIDIPVDDNALEAALKNVEWAVAKIINREFPMRVGKEKCEQCDFGRICSKQHEDFKTSELPPVIKTPKGDYLAGAFTHIDN